MHIDPWTLGLQTINVLVLVWLLARFLFRPIAGIIAARRAAADAVLAEAEAVRANAETEAAGLARERRELAEDASRLVAAARAQGETEREAIVRRAEDAAKQTRDAAERQIEADRHDMRQTLRHEAADLALTLTERLVGRLPARSLNRVFLDDLAATVAAHPAREALASVPLEIRTAAPLDPASRAACAEMLGRPPDGAAGIRFSTDPTLLAGIELSFPDGVIRDSWRADIDRLARALHDDHELVSPSLA